jgi:hypothetical protein
MERNIPGTLNLPLEALNIVFPTDREKLGLSTETSHLDYYVHDVDSVNGVRREERSSYNKGTQSDS